MTPTLSPEAERARNSIATARAERGTTTRTLQPARQTSNPVQPAVSASALVNPPAPVQPPAPVVNTNDGSRTNALVGNVATNNQEFITSQSEAARNRDELAGILGNQTFDAAGARAGLTEQFGVTANLSRLQDIQTQLAQQNTNTAVQNSRIESAAGQTLGQAGREVTQNDRESAIRTAGLAAEASVLQGNIETASTLINNAMQDYYSDRTLTNQNMIQQLEYYSGIADQETAQLLKQEQRKYEEDQKKVERVLGTVDAALVSGAATADEIKNITDPALTEDERLTLAQGIVARKATADYNLEKAIKGREYERLGLEIQSANAKLLAAQNAASSGVLTPDQFAIANDLRKEVNNMQEVKDTKDLEGNTASLIAALEQENGVGDISAINSFQRLVVDPGVAVREGDVALLQSAMSFTDEAKLRAQGLIVGDKLTPRAREQMKALVEDVYRIRVELVDRNTSQIRTMAQEQGIDYGKYIGNTFKTFEQLQASALKASGAEFGIPQNTNDYLDTVTGVLLTDPTANPFGVSLQ